MKFSSERASIELFEELTPLLFSHFDEIAHYKDIKLDPDFDRYLDLDKSGILRTYTARLDDGLLIGYAVFFVSRNIHYRNSTQAIQDILFIDKSHRGFGKEFIAWCDDELRKSGVQVVAHHIKEKYNFGPLLKRIGYELVDLVYMRRLDGR